jgi:hypothetical protein
MRRVIDFAEMLYNLQSIEGYDNCVAQLNDPQLEGTLAELEVGKLLQIHGVRFRFIVPQGVSGMDYDLEVFMPDSRSAVADTKCKIESSSTSKSTIKSQLEKARSQLPSDSPGMVFLKVPQDWMVDAQQWVENEYGNETISSAVRSFLRNTGRIVSVKVYSSIIHVYQNRPGTVGLYRVWEFNNFTSRFGGDWHIFHKIAVLHGVGPRWVSLSQIVNPLPSITHPGVL